MTRNIDASLLKTWLHDGRELALFDVREHGQFGESHLFHAVPLPYSQLERDIGALAPRAGTRIVLCDDSAHGTQGVAERAAQRLNALGYRDVHVLAGGTSAWRAAGQPLFAGVNVPSKTFGELVEHRLHTPRIDARELDQMLRDGQNVAVLDARPVDEYRKMNIPGSRCCPNGELAYRIGRIVDDPSTRIVINCAGRTRSIIGAQTLRNLGVPNPVYALEDGTQGWMLADLTLEHGSDRLYPDVPGDANEHRAMRDAASALARRHGVRDVTSADVARWLDDAARTTYVFDVRTAEEYAAAHLPGAVHAPGGQLIQATDQWVGVRGARLVLVDTDGIRAPVVASWLRQMGHDAWLLVDGANAALHVSVMNFADSLPAPTPIDAATLKRRLAHGDAGECRVLDVRASMAFRQAHIPGAQWSIRPIMVEQLAGNVLPVVLVADDSALARIAAHELVTQGLAPHGVALLDGGFAAWQAAGYPVDGGAHTLPDAECIDYLFFVHDRHQGNKAAARQYLAWEKHLIGQLDAQDLAQFRID